MESVILKILGHLDLNKDNKPDLEQIHALVDKYGPVLAQLLPLLKAFVDAGGLASLKSLLKAHLSVQAFATLEAIEKVAISASK